MINEKLADMIMKKLPINIEEDRIKYLKCKFGIQSVLIDIFKAIIIYGIAIYFDMLMSVLLFQIGYLLVRTFGYGAHAAKNTICTIISVVMFIGIPYIIKNYYCLDKIYLMVMLAINFLIIIKYAPSSTNLNPINDQKKRKNLKLLTLLCNTCALVICYLNANDTTNNYLVIGSFIACLFMLPITHKILRGGYQSEKY